MIKLNEIKEQECILYCGADKIGYIDNELTLYDARCQIKEGALDGYYIEFDDEYYYINENGKFDEYPVDLFPAHSDMLDYLIGISKDKVTQLTNKYGGNV